MFCFTWRFGPSVPSPEIDLFPCVFTEWALSLQLSGIGKMRELGDLLRMLSPALTLQKMFNSLYILSMAFLFSTDLFPLLFHNQIKEVTQRSIIPSGGKAASFSLMRERNWMKLSVLAMDILEHAFIFHGTRQVDGVLQMPVSFVFASSVNIILFCTCVIPHLYC